MKKKIGESKYQYYVPKKKMLSPTKTVTTKKTEKDKILRPVEISPIFEPAPLRNFQF